MSTQEPRSSPRSDPEVEAENTEEADSNYGDIASSTASVGSSIFEYRQLHGRTYHNQKDTEYWGPNDERQNEQLDLGHHMLTMLLDDKLHLAPIKKDVGKVLDVGTGTGIWAIDFADEHPSAAVVGTDLSPIQPSWVPPNVSFEIDDAQLDWTFADSSIDFVHIRCLMGSIDNWSRLFEQAFRCTKPGGYIETLEMDIQFTSDDGTVKPGHTMYEWSQIFIDAGEKMGRTFKIARQAKQLIQDAGFVDVEEKKYKVPVGDWMEDSRWKEIGKWNAMYLLTGLEGMALYILKNVLGWQYEEIQVLIAQMRRAIRDRQNHGYYEITVVYGRKP